MLRYIRIWDEEFYNDPRYIDVVNQPDWRKRVFFDATGEGNKNTEYLIGTTTLWSPCNMEQFHSCCGIGVIHNLWRDSFLQYTNFTPEILASAIKQNMEDLKAKETYRDHYMAVVLGKDYEMWKEVFTILGGKEVRKFKNRNSDNINFMWEIPSV